MPSILKLSRAEHDSYWRFVDVRSEKKRGLRDMLTTAGCPVVFGWNKRRLLEEVARVNVARLWYNRTDIAEKQLRQFIRDRRLLMPKALQLQDLEDVLYDADLHPAFDRLHDLPPELRSRIYRMYLSEFARVLESPTQPPLSRASRQLRKEVLPLFYQSMTFELLIVDVSDCRDDPDRKKLRFDIWTSSFLQSIPAEMDGCLRSVRLTVGRAPTAHTPRCKINKSFIFDVDVTKTEASRVEGRRIFGHLDTVQGSALQDVLSKTVDDICEKQTTKGLRASDISSLRRAVEFEYFAAD